ncbi:MAG: hypothetical protein O7B99_15285 [Planctomycetota bacterium]|nr:hypothetical protein [Planctomycetota bacterium]
MNGRNTFVRAAALAVLVALSTWGCDSGPSEAEIEARGLARTYETLRDEAVEARVEADARTARMIALNTSLMADLAESLRDVQDDAERAAVVASVSAELDRIEAEAGDDLDVLGLLVRARVELGRGLLGPEPDDDDIQAARVPVDRALALSAKLVEEDPNKKQFLRIHGDAHVGMGDVAYAAGNHAMAIDWYRQGLDILTRVDKGRGSGTGKQGRKTGEGKGKGGGGAAGGGKNKAESLALKREMLDIQLRTARSYCALDDHENEIFMLERGRRLTLAGICKMEFTNNDNRLEFSRNIELIAEAMRHKGDERVALFDERLALNIMEEILELEPNRTDFRRRIADRTVAVCRQMKRMGTLEADTNGDGEIDRDIPYYVQRGFDELEWLSKAEELHPDRDPITAELSYYRAWFEHTKGLASADGERKQRLESARDWYGRAIAGYMDLEERGLLTEELAVRPAEVEAGLLEVETALRGS